jgi:hypothetical protein
MAQFKDLTDDVLQQLGTRIIRNAEQRIRKQIPRPNNRPTNPFATGKLARSLQFSWEKNSEGVYELDISYLDYGKYTAFGTRSYNDSAARDAGFFGRDFVGYRRGNGGIRPQYWLGLRGDRPVYEAIVEAELKMTWETFLNNTISGFKRGNQI